MHDVVDVAEQMLAVSGPIATPKLHALLYLAQGNHLAATDQPLFTASIEAWAQGPVIPTLYGLHRDHDVVHPGELYRARHALARNRATVTRLRALVPTVLGVRSVRRIHRSTSARAPIAHPSPPHPKGALTS